jgi:predicted nucleic-acid-binding protein
MPGSRRNWQTGMLAVDTNVVVRYLTGDHPAQSAAARHLIDGNDVFICTTVLLETEWVLRSAYHFTPAQIAPALRRFGGLQRVTIEEPARIAQALDWMEAGMDFADALHVAKAAACEAFISFDAHLARTAQRAGTIAVRAP